MSLDKNEPLVKYLEKRHTVIDGICHLTDVSMVTIIKLFGNESIAMLNQWVSEKVDGNIYIIVKNTIVYWYKDGLLHREDGPAISSDNTEEWYFNGLQHRDDGPAVVFAKNEYNNGRKVWYINGKYIKEER